MAFQTVHVIGAGILGLWQAYQLAKDGFRVRLYEKSSAPFAKSSSRLAGAMLAPFCESEAPEQHLIEPAVSSLTLWQDSPFPISQNGTLVVCAPRDRSELAAFSKRTLGHQWVERSEIATLEPDLVDQFDQGLYFKDEAHLAPRPVMQALLAALQNMGVDVQFGVSSGWSRADFVVDCRGMGARSDLANIGATKAATDRANLRPVRGEMMVVDLPGLQLTRPVRLLHPRMPCYIVPWPDGRYMIGATVFESDDDGPVSVRSALELLGAAFAVTPRFGEAKILEFSAGARPSLPDNLPKIFIDGRTIFVNGAYRHGFLLAPLLARHVSDYLTDGKIEGMFFDASGD